MKFLLIKKGLSLFFASLTSGIILSAILFTIPAMAAECDNVGMQLRGSNQVIQGQGGGGLWGIMQKSDSMKSEAMIGMQIDSKLQLSVTNYESKCEDGGNPGKEMSDKISSFMDRAMEIKNKSRRGSPDEIILLLKSLNSDIGEFLESSN